MDPKDIHPIFRKLLTSEKYKELEEEIVQSNSFELSLIARRCEMLKILAGEING